MKALILTLPSRPYTKGEWGGRRIEVVSAARNYARAVNNLNDGMETFVQALAGPLECDEQRQALIRSCQTVTGARAEAGVLYLALVVAFADTS